MEWTAANITLLDGRLQQAGIDVEEALRGPLRRFVALVHSLIVEHVSWAKEEDRNKILAALEWPEVRERDELEESDRQARAAMRAYGIDIDFEAAARARAAAMQEREGRVGNNDPVSAQQPDAG